MVVFLFLKKVNDSNEGISPMRKAQGKLKMINIKAIKQETKEYQLNSNDDFLDVFEEMEKIGEVKRLDFISFLRIRSKIFQ